MLAVAQLAVASQIISFEASEGFTPGGAWPAGFSATTTGGGIAQVSTDSPTHGSQCIALSQNLGSGLINYYPNLPVPAGEKTVIQFDIRPGDYSPPDYFNFSGYGGLYIFDQDYYWIGGVNFELKDYDGYDPASADDFKITFFNSAQMEIVGIFIPGDYYRYTLIIDRITGTTTHSLDTLGGAPVASRSYTNSASIITWLYIGGTQAPGSCTYVDRLFFSSVSVADFIDPIGVDLLDYTVFVASWMSTPADPHWNPNCNLDDAGQSQDLIDLADLVIFCDNWLN